VCLVHPDGGATGARCVPFVIIAPLGGLTGSGKLEGSQEGKALNSWNQGEPGLVIPGSGATNGKPRCWPWWGWG